VTDDLLTWKSEWDLLPLDDVGTAWSGNWAAYFAARNDSKLTFNPATIVGAPATFTFAQPAFQTPLAAGLPPDPTGASGIAAIASAWEASILASTMSALPGISVGAPSPATTFSAIASIVVEPTSLTAAKAALIAALTAAPPVSTPLSSAYPGAFRDAFLMLQYVITGTNSVSPPAGPNPLVAVTGVV